MDLTDKTILVTGASSGIGRETSILLSELGARVILVARDQKKLAETFSTLSGSGHVIESFDLLNILEIKNWLKQLAQKIGALDGMVHCAGIQQTQPLRFINLLEAEQLLKLNLASSIALAQAFRQKGVCQSPASLVFLSSVMGLVGQIGIAAYSASKGAIISLSKSLALELAAEKIRVNCIAPGVVETAMAEQLFSVMNEEQINRIKAMHPLGLGQPRDVAHAIAFLLSDAAKWITGSCLVVDGGYTAH